LTPLRRGIDEVQEPIRSRVLLGTLTAGPILAGPTPSELDAEIRDLGTTLADRHAGWAPSEIAGLAPARELYRSLGIDPTRHRPGSEALFRRAVKGKPLPRILGAVDVCTLCSVEFLLPICLYDAGRIRGPVVLRIGRAGESYPGIRKGEIHLDGRPALFDEDGPFGNPTSDSLRTSVREETASLVMVIFAPASYPRERMDSHVAFARDRIERYLGAPGAPVEFTTALLP
jgi:DNA/RNA-binding domain of Phe-tRNA-synthetase-like protein